MQSTIDEIKKRIDIVEFIGAFVPLKKAGKNYKANCPFHSEKTPSFMVSPDRELWKCFGACQDGGDVISFLMKWENITFSEALKELAQKAGVALESFSFEDRQWKEKEKLMQMNAFAAKYFHFLLMEHQAGDKARQYVKKRGLNKKLLETFLLGYAPQSWDSLIKFLKRKKYKDEDIVQSGLAIKNEKGRLYDRFRGRLMFPIINARHEILGFSGRLLSSEAKEAKYVNTPETPLYHKRETLFGMHVAHEAIRERQAAVLVEGEFDMISSFKHDIKNTVAIKGSAVTRDQLMLLKRFTTRVILALDADFSGAQTTLRAIKDAESMDFRVDVIQFDSGKDPDEALQNNPIAYKKTLQKPTPIYDFIIDLALKRHDPQDPYGKKEIAVQALPFLHSIANPIVKGHYMKKLADILDVHEHDITSMARTFDKESEKKRVYQRTRNTSPDDRYSTLQKYILAVLVQSDHTLKVCSTIASQIQPEDFSIPAYKNIFTYFIDYIHSKENDQKNFNLTSFTATFSDPLQAILDELFLFDLSVVPTMDEHDTEKTFHKSLLELKQYALRSRIKGAAQNIHDADSITALSRKLAQVEKELRIL